MITIITVIISITATIMTSILITMMTVMMDGDPAFFLISPPHLYQEHHDSANNSISNDTTNAYNAYDDVDGDIFMVG